MEKETERPRLSVGAIIFNKEGKILLLKSPKWQNKYIFPSGHVEMGETLEKAIKREVKEETGLEVDIVKFLRVAEFIYPHEYFIQNLHFVGIQFLCKTQDNEVKVSEEADSFVWVRPKEALNLDLESSSIDTIKFCLDILKENNSVFS